MARDRMLRKQNGSVIFLM